MTILHDSDRAWRKFGRTEPYYAVCSNSEFRGENLTDESREQFFRSGDDHVRTLMQIINEQLAPDLQPQAALDFGCGVGRIVIPLAEYCERVVGVDVSPAMLIEAQRNCTERGLKHVEFVETLDQITPANARFDLVHSFIVLQHIPSSRGMRLLNDLIDRVADGGVGALHVTYCWDVPRIRKVVNWLRRWIPLLHQFLNLVQGFSFARPMMLMNNYSLNQICRLLQQKNCHEVVLRFTNHSNHLGVMILFRKISRTNFR